MQQDMALSIKVTASCQELCEWCGVKTWMHKNKGYQCSMESIDKLVKYSKDAGYHFRQIIYSGGEPFLWDHIEEATKMIYDSGITDAIKSYTNGFWITKDTNLKELCELFTEIIFSLYCYNTKQAALATKTPNVRVLNRESFVKNIPQRAYPGTLPAKCGCRAYGMVGDRITLCTAMDFIAARNDWDIDDLEGVICLQPKFLDYLKEFDPYNRDICMFCSGNSNVSRQLRKIPNLMGKTEC